MILLVVGIIVVGAVALFELVVNSRASREVSYRLGYHDGYHAGRNERQDRSGVL